MYAIAEHAKMNRPQRMLKHPAALTNHLALREQGIMADSQLTFTLENSQSATPVEYRDIPNCPGYRAGSDGTIWSKFTGEWKLKTLTKLKKNPSNPYLMVCLVKNWKQHRQLAHTIILEAFRGPRPAGMVGCHYDDDHSNNAISNLRWDTRESNDADVVRNGKTRKGESNGWSKLTECEVLKIRELVASGMSCIEVSKLFPCNARSVSAISLGRSWKHVGGPLAERREGVKRRELKP